MRRFLRWAGQGYFPPRFEGWLVLICIIMIVWTNLRQSHQIDALEARIEIMSEEALSAKLGIMALWHHYGEKDE